MSSIKLTADSGGGTFELKAPSSGSNARVLTVPDTASGTVLTTTNPKAGNILQVVNVDIANTTITTNSTSFVSMNTSVSITPSATSSKVLILLTGGGTYLPSSTSFAYVTVYRDSTNIGDSTTGLESMYNTGTSYAIIPHSLSVLDSPNTTSAITYTIYARCVNGTYQFQNTDRAHATLTAMEVAG